MSRSIPIYPGGVYVNLAFGGVESAGSPNVAALFFELVDDENNQKDDEEKANDTPDPHLTHHHGSILQIMPNCGSG